MNNDLSLEALVTHLQQRRNALNYDLVEIEKRAAEIRGAIQETHTLEQQALNGMLAKSRLSCE